MQNSSMSLKQILIIIFLTLTGGMVGFILGSSKNTVDQKLSQVQVVKSSVKTDDFFASQTATLQGKISNVASNTITLINSKNQTGQFPMAKAFSIYSYSSTTPAATVSSKIKDIVLNQQASVSLQLQDGVYKVVSITYLPNPREK